MDPKEFEEVIAFKPAIIENWFSRGLATAEAMFSGLAPGRFAVINRVGKSTLGRSLTGSELYATNPNIAMADIINVVAMGLSIKLCEIFTGLVNLPCSRLE